MITEGAVLAPGDLIDGKYRVKKLLGRGGMGAVYEGENERIARRVAIKVLHPNVAADADLVARFEREAQAAARIGSAHIVDVLDLGDLPTGERFMVMEYLEGESLAARLARGKLLPADCAEIALQLVTGLTKVHDASILHRDLKPPNIFLAKADPGDFVKILDFGVCKFQKATALTNTKKADLVGTLWYMAPEQLDTTKKVDLRADLYAVGVILFQCLTGALPYDAKTFAQLISRVVAGPPARVANAAAGIDPALAAIVEKAMARAPEDRYQNGRELATAIARWLKQAHRVDRALAEFLDQPAESSHEFRRPAVPPKATASQPDLSVAPDASTGAPTGARTDATEDATETVGAPESNGGPIAPAALVADSTATARSASWKRPLYWATGIGALLVAVGGIAGLRSCGSVAPLHARPIRGASEEVETLALPSPPLAVVSAAGPPSGPTTGPLKPAVRKPPAPPPPPALTTKKGFATHL